MPELVAQPWWVNAMLLAPLLAYFSWRRAGVPLLARTLVISGVFAASFGFLEATVVVYLRAAAGLLPGYRGTLSDVIRLSGEFYRQPQAKFCRHIKRTAIRLFAGEGSFNHGRYRAQRHCHPARRATEGSRLALAACLLMNLLRCAA